MMMKRFCQYLFGASLAMTMSFDASAVDDHSPEQPPLGRSQQPILRAGVDIQVASEPGIVGAVDGYLSAKYPLDPPDLVYKQNAASADRKRVGSGRPTQPCLIRTRLVQRSPIMVPRSHWAPSTYSSRMGITSLMLTSSTLPPLGMG